MTLRLLKATTVAAALLAGTTVGAFAQSNPNGSTSSEDCAASSTNCPTGSPTTGEHNDSSLTGTASGQGSGSTGESGTGTGTGGNGGGTAGGNGGG
ncbi:hypothetical protein SAMN05216548_1017 [Faunimonas pinastri]|uniref:Uncharacterized protein n=1 Tax=Faunimonas pinastri TaxID=1855383 RepID=A0A1H8Z204_9HYPH|nr:hypothetical protein [Faunimonas pinastri]SEP58297.1 hypothetical protein SAMN05216548_1017 [Faunimonas pinastri]